MGPDDYYMPLFLELTPPNVRYHYNPELPLDGHEIILRPLLNSSMYAYVYGLNRDSDLYKANADILIPEKGKFRLDLTKECIRGHELLWNVTGWKRGSIIIVCKPESVDFTPILAGCYHISILATPNTANTLSATKNCRIEMDKGNLSVCFTASAGFAWMQIYANEPLKSTILSEGKRLIKKD